MESHFVNFNAHQSYPLYGVPTPQKADLAIYYELSEGESTENRGIVEVEPATGRSGENSCPQRVLIIQHHVIIIEYYNGHTG